MYLDLVDGRNHLTLPHETPQMRLLEVGHTN